MKKILLAIIISCLSVALLKSQKTDANIFGHVICSNCGHIQFATVSVRGTAIGTNTDETGHFMLVNLPEGTHIIRVQAIGFKPAEKEIAISSGQTQEVNFTLEQDILGLEEVVVTADRSEMKRIESAGIVNTISPRIFNSTQSVALIEGLQFSTGLRIENNCQNCGFSQVRMNGMEGPYSQILVNSRPIFSNLAAVYGLELIPATMIERVEVVRGGGSALYGSNAIAGTINIILKETVMDSYEAGFSSSFIGSGLSDAGKAAPDISYSLNTSHLSSDGRSGISVYGFMREREMFDANSDSFSEIAPMSILTLGSHIYHRTGTRSKISLDVFTINEERNGGNMQDYPLHEREIGEFVSHRINTGALTFEKYLRDYDLFTVYFSAQDLKRDSYYGANRSLKDYGLTSDLTFSAGAQYKYLSGRSTFVFGLESSGSSLTDRKLGFPDYNNAVIVNDTIVSVPHTENILISDQAAYTNGLFLQYDLKLGNFKAGMGGRLDQYRITDHGNNSSSKSGIVFSPRLNLMYSITSYLQARLSYSHGYRAPQIFDEDLHIETSGSRQVVTHNDPLLKQETSNSLMFSLDFNRLIGTVTTGFLAEVFLTRLNDPFVNEIGIPGEDGKVVYTRKNAAEGAEVAGINIEAKLKPLNDFMLTSGFTIQSSVYDKPQEFGTRKFFRSPPAYGYFNADWDMVEDLCWSFTGTYTGTMLVPYFGPDTDPVSGELRRSQRFVDLGTRLEYTVRLNGFSVQLSSGMKNIFNAYQSDFDMGINRDPSYMYGPVLPRTIYFGIKLGNRLEK